MQRPNCYSREAGSIRVWLVTAVLLLCLAVLVFLKLGSWLVREDPLAKCKAVVVLSGGMPTRALEAAKLYREGYAAEVWLTSPAEPKRSMATLGISFQGEEEGNRQILVRQGVPEKTIQMLSPDIANTADELRAIAEAMKATHVSGVIVVTSKVHTRRVRTLWDHLEGGQGQIVVRAAEDSFDPGHWWRTTQDALDVVREVLGLLNVWAGLPLKPAG